MPLTAQKTIIQKDEVVAESFEIITFTVNLAQDRIHVTYQYKDASGAAIGEKSFTATASTYQVVVTTGGTIYAEIKAVLYQAGIDVGEFPSGVIT